MPNRVQRTRLAGQPAIPEGSVYVGRARGAYGYWGNPFKAAEALECEFAQTMDEARQYVTDVYRDWLNGDMPIPPEAAGTRWSRERRDWILDNIGQLAGKDLACWCRIPDLGKPDPCHAQVLIVRGNAHLIRQAFGPIAARRMTVREQNTAVDAYNLIQSVDGPDIARSWMLGQNPHLDDEAPLLAIEAGRGGSVLAAARAHLEGVHA